MDRIYESNAAVTPPSPPANPSSGYPTAGDPASGVPATRPGDYWYHMITESLVKIIEASGLTPDHTNLDQLATALSALFVDVNGDSMTGPLSLSGDPTSALHAATKQYVDAQASFAAAGYQKLPGGLIIQWGVINVPSNSSVTFTFPVAFPNACLVAVAEGNNSGGQGVGAITGWTTTDVVVNKNSSFTTGDVSLIAIGY